MSRSEWHGSTQSVLDSMNQIHMARKHTDECKNTSESKETKRKSEERDCTDVRVNKITSSTTSVLYID